MNREELEQWLKEDLQAEADKDEPDWVLIATTARYLDEISHRRLLRQTVTDAGREAWPAVSVSRAGEAWQRLADPPASVRPPSFRDGDTVVVPLVRPNMRTDHPRTADNVSHASQACKTCKSLIGWKEGWWHADADLDRLHVPEPQP